MNLPKISLNPDVVSQRLDDEMVLCRLDTEIYYRLNEVSAVFWECLEKEPDPELAIAAVMADFQVSEQQVRQDYASWTQALVDKGLAEFTQ